MACISLIWQCTLWDAWRSLCQGGAVPAVTSPGLSVLQSRSSSSSATAESVQVLSELVQVPNPVFICATKVATRICKQGLRVRLRQILCELRKLAWCTATARNTFLVRQCRRCPEQEGVRDEHEEGCKQVKCCLHIRTQVVRGRLQSEDIAHFTKVIC
jgi:hypothetical protein